MTTTVYQRGIDDDATFGDLVLAPGAVALIVDESSANESGWLAGLGDTFK